MICRSQIRDTEFMRFLEVPYFKELFVTQRWEHWVSGSSTMDSGLDGLGQVISSA